jgi:hypothetical protein
VETLKKLKTRILRVGQEDKGTYFLPHNNTGIMRRATIAEFE